MGDRQALAGALADRLGGEERIEDALLDVRRHAAAGVGDFDLGPFAVGARLDADPALALAAVPTTSPMACAAFTRMLRNTWLSSAGEHGTGGRFASRSVSISATYFHSLRRHGDGALDRAVEIGGGLLARRVRELLHGAHDLGDAIDAFQGLVERARNLLLEVVEVGFAGSSPRRRAADLDQLREQRVELAEAIP